MTRSSSTSRRRTTAGRTPRRSSWTNSSTDCPWASIPSTTAWARRSRPGRSASTSWARTAASSTREAWDRSASIPRRRRERSPPTSVRRLALRRSRLLDEGGRARRVLLAVEADHHRELPARGLGHEEVHVDAGVAEGARDAVPHAGPVVAGDEQRRRGYRPQPRALRGRGSLGAGDGVHLDDGLGLAGLAVAHQDLQVRLRRGQGLEDGGERARPVLDPAPPEGDFLDGDGHGRLLLVSSAA